MVAVFTRLMVPLATALITALPTVEDLTVPVICPLAFVVPTGCVIVSVAPLEEESVTVAPLTGLFPPSLIVTVTVERDTPSAYTCGVAVIVLLVGEAISPTGTAPDSLEFPDSCTPSYARIT